MIVHQPPSRARQAARLILLTACEYAAPAVMALVLIAAAAPRTTQLEAVTMGAVALLLGTTWFYAWRAGRGLR